MNVPARPNLYQTRYVPRPTATTTAYEALKRKVLVCELGPGTELRENDLASALALSRTPVREALNRLVHDGLVEVRPRQGYRVTDVTLAGVNEVFELREALEPAIVALVAQRADAQALTRLRQEIAVAGRDTLEDAITADHALHTALADLSNNRYMARTMRHLLAELQRILFLSLSDGGARLDLSAHHDALFDALLAGDSAAARQALLVESTQMRQRIVEAIMTRLPDVSLQSGVARAWGAGGAVGPGGPARPSLRFT